MTGTHAEKPPASELTSRVDDGKKAPLWRRLVADERVRYLAVGAFNTGLGYGSFVALELIGGRDANYFVSLYGSYLMSTVVAFFLHRHVTYRRTGTGRILVDFIRFQGVYVVVLAINTVALPLLVEGLGMNSLVAQALIVVVTTVSSYVGHKYFSFRRPSAE